MSDEPTELPFQISTVENAEMESHDIMLQIGGLKTKTEADDFALRLAEFMEDTLNNVWHARVQ